MRISDWSSDVCSSDLRFRLWLAEQIAVEPTISRRSFNPDISGAQFVAQVRDRRDLPESPVDLAVIANHDLPPFLAEGHGSVSRQIALARPVKHAEHFYGGDRFRTALSGPELEHLKQIGGELA